MKRLFFIGISILLIGCMLTGCMCIPRRVPETYQCGITIYVNNSTLSLDGSTTTITAGDLATSQSLVKTYGAILQSQRVRTEAIELSGVTAEFTVTTEPLDETEVLCLIVETANPQDAYDLACAYAEIAPEAIGQIVEGSSTKIIDTAVMPQEPASYRWEFGN